MTDSLTDFLFNLNSYYDDVLDDYSDVPLVEVNPDYGVWTDL